MLLKWEFSYSECDIIYVKFNTHSKYFSWSKFKSSQNFYGLKSNLSLSGANWGAEVRHVTACNSTYKLEKSSCILRQCWFPLLNRRFFLSLYFLSPFSLLFHSLWCPQPHIPFQISSQVQDLEHNRAMCDRDWIVPKGFWCNCGTEQNGHFWLLLPRRNGNSLADKRFY